MLKVLAIFLSVSTALSATLYCGDAATGDGSGSDWNNQADFDTLVSSGLTRGNTYYLADGTSYSGKTFDDANSGTTTITIKKATVADHGTETGWLDTLGDGQAVFTGNWFFESDYWIVDGNTPLATYGIKIVYSYTAGFNTTIRLWSSGVAYGNNSQLKGIEMDLSGSSGDVNGIHSQYGVDSLTVYNCRIYLCPADAFSFSSHDNLIVEHCHVDQRGDSQGVHADAFVNIGTGANNHIRYNLFEWNGQQIYIAEFSHNELAVYGNIFKGDDSGGAAAKGVYTQSANPSVTELLVYNNTFVDLDSASLSLGSDTTGDARNNLFYNVPDAGFGSMTHDYNWFETGMSTASEANAQTGSDPFVNYAGENYRLAATTDAGDATIGATYNTDADSNTRGADGTWDRGAFEFEAEGGGTSGGGGAGATVGSGVTFSNGVTVQ